MISADSIVAWRNRGEGRVRRKLAQCILVLLFSFDLPPDVEVGDDVIFLHNCLGSVIHPRVSINRGAMICQNVTIGDGNACVNPPTKNFERIVVCEEATICAGAKVLCSEGVLTIGRGAVIGANAVVTRSVPENEIWAGVPARKIKKRVS